MNDSTQSMNAHFAALYNGSLSIDEYAVLLEQRRAQGAHTTFGLATVKLGQRTEVARITAANES
jgi:hypothetical protein